MSIKLSDCPPQLRAAILKQLAVEGRLQPKETYTYAVAQMVAGEWRVGPDSDNKALMAKLVRQLQNATKHSVYLTSKGQPNAVMLKFTWVTTIKQDGKANPKKLKKQETIKFPGNGKKE